jgi:hypothetical protein
MEILRVRCSAYRMWEPPIMAEPEVEELERAAAWRLRLVDADPTDTASAAAARLLEALATDLRDGDHGALWTELRALGNWLAESDAISDYAEQAAEYRTRIGITEHPVDAAAYLHELLTIARSLV